MDGGGEWVVFGDSREWEEEGEGGEDRGGQDGPRRDVDILYFHGTRIWS